MCKKFVPFRFNSETLRQLSEMQFLPEFENRTQIVESAIELLFAVKISQKKLVIQGKTPAIQQKKNPNHGISPSKLINHALILPKNIPKKQGLY